MFYSEKRTKLFNHKKTDLITETGFSRLDTYFLTTLMVVILLSALINFRM